MADRNVKVTVRADVADFLRNTGLAARAAEDLGRKTEQAGQKAKTGLSGMAQHVRDNRDAWGSIGGSLTAYGIAVTGLTAIVAKTGIEYNTLRQRSGAALTTLTGSAEEAAAQMAKLDDFATNSPFARDVFIRAQQQMFGFGIEAQKVIPYLDAIQNAVAASGGSNNDISELSTIFSQISASAKITATDLREFGNRGIDAATIIGSQMGKTGAQIREDITAGTLDAGTALDALAAGMQDRFGGAADNVKNTMLGAVDRVKAAFRDLSSSAMTPFVDPDGGGLAVDGLNRLADALRAFEDLPGPLRNTALGVGALSGAAALIGGAAMLAVPRMVDFYDALGRMGTQGRLLQDGLRRVPGILGGLIKAAGGAAVLLTVATGLQRISQSSWDAAPGIEETTRALLDLRDVGNEGQLDRLIDEMDIVSNGWMAPKVAVDSLADAINRLDNPNAVQRIENLDSVLPGVQTSGDRAAEALAAVDAALAGMVSRGDVAGAQAALAAALEGSGIAAEQAMEHLPGYRDALIGLENEARAAAGSTGDLVGALVLLPEGAPSYLDRLRESAGTMAEAIGGAAESFVDFGDSINDAEVSLDAWLTNIETQLVARANYLENIAFLQAAGVNAAFLEGLAEQGAEGATRAQQMVDAITGGDAAVVERANEIGNKMGTGVSQAAADSIAQAEFPEVALKAEMEENSLYQAAITATAVIEEQANPVVGVDADAQAAYEKVSLWAADTADQFGITKLDSNPELAYRQIEDWNNYAKTVEGMPLLNSDPTLAQAQLDGWLAEARRSEGMAKLNADRSPGDRVASAWQASVRGMFPFARIGASDSSARSTARGLQGWINGLWSTINVTARYAGGLNMGGADRTRYSARASGGVERRPMMMGPGYGPTNVILAGEPETRGEAFISNHPNFRRENEQYLRIAAGWFGMDLVKAYAAGGVARSSSAPANTVGSVTAVLAPEDRALLAAVARRPIQLEADGQVMALSLIHI